MSNIRTVVSLGREKMFYEKYTSYLIPAVLKVKHNSHMRGVTYGVARSIMFFAYGACMMYGGQLVVNDNVPISTVFT